MYTVIKETLANLDGTDGVRSQGGTRRDCKGLRGSWLLVHNLDGGDGFTFIYIYTYVKGFKIV